VNKKVGSVERLGPDLTVYAPAAIWPDPTRRRALDSISAEVTPQDIIAMQAAEIRELKKAMEIHKIATHTITRFCICCMHVILLHTGEDVVSLDRELFEKFKGAEIQIAEWQEGNAGPVFGRFLEKSPDIMIGGDS
jgi:hypothetical protein